MRRTCVAPTNVAKLIPESLFFQAREILCERAPVRRELEVLVGDVIGGDDRVIERRDRTALAGDLRRNSLKDL